MNGVRRGKGGPHHGPGQGRRPGRRPAGPATSPRRPQPGLGRRLHLLPDLGRVRLRRLHRRRLRPTDRRLARRHRQAHRPGPHPAADGAVGPRPRRPSRRAGKLIHHSDAGVAIHVAPVHRAPRPRGHRPLDRHRRRRLRQRPHGIDHRPVQDRVHRAPPSSTTGPTRPSPTSSTPPPAGSTGTTTAGSTAPSGWSRPPSSSKPTTLPHNREPQPV